MLRHVRTIPLVLAGSLLAFSGLASSVTRIPKIEFRCAPCGCPHDEKVFEGPGECPSCAMPLRPSVSGLEVERATRSRPTVGILIFEMADVMDVMGPLSVFEHAGFEVFTFAKELGPVGVGHNLILEPDYDLASLPEVDVLMLPGSGLAETNPGDEAIVSFLRARAPDTEVIFSVCSGAFFLGEAGLLDGRRATTFAGLIPRLEQSYPKADVVDDLKYTDNGQIVTSAGLSSGIDAAFHVVARFYGEGRAQDLANHMEYQWTRAEGFARSQLADRYLVGAQEVLGLFATRYLSSNGDEKSWTYRYSLTEQVETAAIVQAILGRLETLDRWATVKKSSEAFSGTMQHPTLGSAAVELSVRREDGAVVATLAARRLVG